jgi:hypothetical protein
MTSSPAAQTTARGASFVWLALALGCNGTHGTLVTLPAQSTPDAAAGDAAPPSAQLLDWQIQLSDTLDTSFDVPWYELDRDTDPSLIATLRAAGRAVACYVSVGSDEPWRSDTGSFPAAAVGKPLPDYSTERWLDVRDPTVRSVNAARLVRAHQNGCDGVELSNLSAHTADSGFPLSQADELDYARFLAGVAHQNGLSAGLSGSDDLVAGLSADFDWGLTAECLAYQSCAAWSPFVLASKPVFMIEYGSTADAPVLCPQAAALGFSLVIKRSALDAFRVGCGF